MTLLETIMMNNAHFVAERERAYSKSPAKKIAIFTCVDTRLVEFLEPAMGLRRGDAMVIKNAGNTIIDPNGGVMRSLVVAVFALGCEEIFVVGHRDCGMAEVDEAAFRESMLQRGVPPEAIDQLRPSLGQWLGGFRDPVGNVYSVVDLIRRSPLIPKDVPVHGLMFDPHTGRLEVLTSGYEAADREAVC